MNKDLQIKKEYGNLYVCKNGSTEDFQFKKNRDDTFDPPLMEGKNYKKWVATDDEKTCLTCISYDGRIFPKDEIVRPHINCRCRAESVSAIYAGEATKDKKKRSRLLVTSLQCFACLLYIKGRCNRHRMVIRRIAIKIYSG